MRYVVLFFSLFTMGVRLNAGAESCESSPAIEAAQRELGQKLKKATFEQSIGLRDQAYRQMTRLDPIDYRPGLQYISHIQDDEPEQLDALREKFVSEARAHSNDFVKLILVAIALKGKDTPQAFRFLDQALANNPNYAPAYVLLTDMYRDSGKFTDKTKAALNLEKYYQLCPSGRDGWAMCYLEKMGSKELKARVANDLRKRLATASDPYVLRSYSDVWSLEFSALPVAEHPKERQRVAEDLDRLRKLPVQASAEWLNFLKDGYKESDAPEAEVKAIEARILREFPHSDEAFGILSQYWDDQHPQPAGEASKAEWQQFMRLSLAKYRELLQQFPQEHGMGWLIEYASHLDRTPSDEIIRDGETYIKESDLYDGPSSRPRTYVAGMFLDHNLEPARALALLQEARRLRDSPREKISSEVPDYATPKDVEDSAHKNAISDAEFHMLFLRACRAAADKAAAAEIKSTVEAAPPSYSKALPGYWNARAILAEIEGHNTDALAFYQKALFLREPPQEQYGVLNDTLLSDAHRVWIASHGSEAAFAIWSHPENSGKPALAEGHWERPDKDLPIFELADLQGKTWKLTQLEGKKVLINIWATWCGPCQAELPHLEKLYEQTKSRSDIGIVSLNFDEDVGMVEPFVKKKGFTFPVLPAYAFLANKIDVNSIPQNWLIDANGKWQWEQIGFNSTEPDWEKSMLSRLEATK